MAQKGRFSQPMDGESQYYVDVKSIKNKSLHAENTEFIVLELQIIFRHNGKIAK